MERTNRGATTRRSKTNARSSRGMYVDGNTVRRLEERPSRQQRGSKEAQIAKAQVSGIGLSNMRERVEALGGTIAFLTDKGFEIRISVPKMSKTRGTR